MVAADTKDVAFIVLMAGPGVNGEKTRTLSELYHKMWALGAAGVTVPLDVLSDSATRRVELPSVNRLDTLKLQSTF